MCSVLSAPQSGGGTSRDVCPVGEKNKPPANLAGGPGRAWSPKQKVRKHGSRCFRPQRWGVSSLSAGSPYPPSPVNQCRGSDDARSRYIRARFGPTRSLGELNPRPSITLPYRHILCLGDGTRLDQATDSPTLKDLLRPTTFLQVIMLKGQALSASSPPADCCQAGATPWPGHRSSPAGQRRPPCA